MPRVSQTVRSRISGGDRRNAGLQLSDGLSEVCDHPLVVDRNHCVRTQEIDQLDSLLAGHRMAQGGPGTGDLTPPRWSTAVSTATRTPTWRTPSYRAVSPEIHSARASRSGQRNAEPITTLAIGLLDGGP